MVYPWCSKSICCPYYDVRIEGFIKHLLNFQEVKSCDSSQFMFLRVDLDL